MQAICSVQPSADTSVHSMGPDVHAVKGHLTPSQGEAFIGIYTQIAGLAHGYHHSVNVAESCINHSQLAAGGRWHCLDQCSGNPHPCSFRHLPCHAGELLDRPLRLVDMTGYVSMLGPSLGPKLYADMFLASAGTTSGDIAPVVSLLYSASCSTKDTLRHSYERAVHMQVADIVLVWLRSAVHPPSVPPGVC